MLLVGEIQKAKMCFQFVLLIIGATTLKDNQLET